MSQKSSYTISYFNLSFKKNLILMKMYACRIIYFSKISWIREINFQSFFFAFQCQILLKIFFKRECNTALKILLYIAKIYF